MPKSALISDKEGTYVVIVDKDNKAEHKYVQTGVETKDQIEIVSGLEEGQRVILQGTENVWPSMPIDPVLINPPPEEEEEEEEENSEPPKILKSKHQS